MYKNKIEKVLFNIFFLPKMGKTVFDPYKVKINIFLNLSSFVAFKEIKERFTKKIVLILG